MTPTKNRPLIHDDPSVPEMAAILYHQQECLDALLRNAHEFAGIDPEDTTFQAFLAEAQETDQAIHKFFARTKEHLGTFICRVSDYVEAMELQYP